MPHDVDWAMRVAVVMKLDPRIKKTRDDIAKAFEMKNKYPGVSFFQQAYDDCVAAHDKVTQEIMANTP